MACSGRRWRRGGLGLLCLLTVVSVGGAARRSPPPLNSADPDAVYLQSSRYDRLYVEVDVVEGAAVDPKWLEDLRRFLVQYARKPNGVQLVRGRPIPLGGLRGYSPKQIAGLHIDGPPADADQRAAFLYVLIYDSRKLGRPKPDNPHVSYADYPCAIYFDTAYSRGAQKAFAANALRHEAGHILGLCKDRKHGDGVHCREPSCLMYPTLVLPPKWSIKPPAKKDLCDHCKTELRAAQARHDDARFSFQGPVLVRRESGYWVMSTPGMVSLAFDARQAADWRGLLARFRKSLKGPPQDRRGIYTTWKLQARGDAAIARLKETLARARRDASPLVQSAARDAQRGLEKDLAKQPPARTLASAGPSKGRTAALGSRKQR